MPKNQTIAGGRLTSTVVFLLSLVIGATGAVGQAMVLHNLLVNSYPYKMMDMPPADFYARIGALGAYVAPVIAVGTTLFLRRARTLIVPAVPVVLCPLLYWLVFEIVTLGSPYQGELMRELNFDQTTGRTAQFEFGYNVLLLMFWGAVIGLTAGTFLTLASNTVSKLTNKNRGV